ALVGLVIGRVHERAAGAGHAVAERRRGVVHELAADAERADAELALTQLDDLHLGRELIHRHGEVRVVHLPPERRGERPIDASRAVDREIRARKEGRQEERQSLDVIGVGVTDEQVGPDRSAAGERDAQLPRTGAAVEDEEGPVVRAGLDARRVAAVPDGVAARRGDGSAHAPEPDPHQCVTGAATAICAARSRITVAPGFCGAVMMSGFPSSAASSNGLVKGIVTSGLRPKKRVTGSASRPEAVVRFRARRTRAFGTPSFSRTVRMSVVAFSEARWAEVTTKITSALSIAARVCW